jgi:CobQ-like glutamine amidotransferase family enzyme
VPELSIVHLYADLLRTYGDRGNVLALTKRAEWRGISVEVHAVEHGDSFPGRAHVVFIGGGSDRAQTLVSEDLKRHASALSSVASSGGVIVGVCGGYQLLGTGYRLPDGTVLEGLGLLDAFTSAGTRRIVGRVWAQAELPDLRTTLEGFENHSGQTVIGPKARPLGTVRRGQGNNGSDRTEGAVQGSIIGTYLHGPVIPLNAAFADWILSRALKRELEPLPDDEVRVQP